MDTKKALGMAIGLLATGYGIYKIVNGSEPQKYTSKWFENVSDEVLKAERENVRQKYCESGNDTSLAVSLYNLLNKFDNVIGERAWAGKEIGYPVHREHGWHLPSDD